MTKMRLVIVAVLGLAVVPARGQAVLSSNSGGFATNPIGSALRDLEIPFTTVQTNQQTLDALRSQSWDLVIMRRQERFGPGFEAAILAELEAHVARGGALHFQMADLENAPDAWYDLLGLEGAVDLELPLSDIFVPSPPHPVWDSPTGGFFRLGNELFPPDYGDALVLGSGSFAVSLFGTDGEPAMCIAQSGRVLVNGQQWDNWESGASVARRQISWLLSCKADLDGDGSLTIFDFLEFQALFDARDVRADVFYDGRFDVFDFLEFFNQFQDGCP